MFVTGFYSGPYDISDFRRGTPPFSKKIFGYTVKTFTTPIKSNTLSKFLWQNELI